MNSNSRRTLAREYSIMSDIYSSAMESSSYDDYQYAMEEAATAVRTSFISKIKGFIDAAFKRIRDKFNSWLEKIRKYTPRNIVNNKEARSYTEYARAQKIVSNLDKISSNMSQVAKNLRAIGAGTKQYNKAVKGSLESIQRELYSMEDAINMTAEDIRVIHERVKDFDVTYFNKDLASRITHARDSVDSARKTIDELEYIIYAGPEYDNNTKYDTDDDPKDYLKTFNEFKSRVNDLANVVNSLDGLIN